MIYVTPKVLKISSEKIAETFEPSTQYQISFNEDMPLVEDITGTYFDDWNFYAEEGTHLVITVTPGANLDFCMWLSTEPPSFPSLFSSCDGGLGVPNTQSAVIPSTGVWRFVVDNVYEWGSGSYSVTIESDKPITGLTLLNDDRYI